MSKVIIVGSVNMDVVAYSPILPQKGQTVLGTHLQYFYGGKGANQAIAAVKAGADTRFSGCVGEDMFGNDLIKNLESHGIKTDIKIVSSVSSGTALITVAEADNIITVIPGANMHIQDADIPADIESGDILLSQLEVKQDIVKEFFRRGKQAKAVNIFNPSPFSDLDKDILSLIDVLIVNQGELSSITGKGNINSEIDEITANGSALRAKNDYKAVVVTLGSRGAILITEEGATFFEPYSVSVIDTTGAGDCFAGVMSAMLSQGHNLPNAVESANKAAAISVTRKGASVSSPTLKEINEFIF